MKRVIAGIAVVLLTCGVLAAGCGSDEEDDAAAGTEASSSSGSSGSTSGDNSDGCMKAGGTCGCAGGCNPGYHPAEGALLFQCPQPCDNCGACGMQCCLPDEGIGGGGTGGGSGGNGRGGGGGSGGTGGAG